MYDSYILSYFCSTTVLPVKKKIILFIEMYSLCLCYIL